MDFNVSLLSHILNRLNFKWIPYAFLCCREPYLQYNEEMNKSQSKADMVSAAE